MKKGIYKLAFDDFNLRVCDVYGSSAMRAVYNEIKLGHYTLDSVPFEEGDIAIDIGAHVGIISMYLAKKYPYITVYSFEPFPDNFSNLYYNVRELNNLSNIKLFPKAITADGRKFEMICNVGDNTGGATGNLADMGLPGHKKVKIDSVTLDSVFEYNKIDTCKLLKIDCEGSEHEILTNFKRLGRVKYLTGEFHINEHLNKQGYSIAKLRQKCLSYLSKSNINVTVIRMAE
jgi:FkbM family methyltransferase